MYQLNIIQSNGVSVAIPTSGNLTPYGLTSSNSLGGNIRNAEFWDDFYNRSGDMTGTFAPSSQPYNFLNSGTANYAKISGGYMYPINSGPAGIGGAYYAQITLLNNKVYNFGCQGTFTGSFVSDPIMLGAMLVTDAPNVYLPDHLLHIYWFSNALHVEIYESGLSSTNYATPNAGISTLFNTYISESTSISFSINGNQVTANAGGQTFTFYDTSPTQVLKNANWNNVAYESQAGDNNNLWIFNEIWANLPGLGTAGLTSQPRSQRLDAIVQGYGIFSNQSNNFTQPNNFGINAGFNLDNYLSIAEYATLVRRGVLHGHGDAAFAGGIVFAPASTYKNWSINNALYADDFCILMSFAASSGPDSWQGEDYTIPKAPIFYIDGGNNRTSIGQTNYAQPTGLATLNVLGSCDVVGPITQSGIHVALLSDISNATGTLYPSSNPSGYVGSSALSSYVTTTGVQTFTNKRYTLRTLTFTGISPITPSGDSWDAMNVVATGNFILNTPTGTPTDFQTLMLGIRAPNGLVSGTLSSGYIIPTSSSLTSGFTIASGSETLLNMLYRVRDGNWRLVSFVPGY